MRHHHRLAWTLALSALVVVPLTAEAGQDERERRHDRQEAREEARERRDDRADRSHVDVLYRSFQNARASNDAEGLSHVDHRVHAYLGAELAEAHRELDRANREVRRDRQEIRSDNREIRENRKDDAGPRERADDRRDKRDDQRDLADDKRDAAAERAHLEQLKKVEAEWTKLMGKRSMKALNRKHALLLALRGMEHREMKQNRQEAREDGKERREDRRERHEDRRERS